jgi:excinuclease ABC subunit C
MMEIKGQILREKVAKLPDLPGVYLFKDKRAQVIYIGKASSLKSRVLSYFHCGLREPKIEGLVNSLTDVDFIVTDSEVEALFLEAKLIREKKPKFNAALKDDKSYPVLTITEEDFPRVFVTRDRRLRAKYYGPFASAKELRLCVSALQRIFKFRTCKIKIEADESRANFRRPCLLYYVQRCTAPCARKISREDYRASIRDFEQLLSGGKKHLIEELRIQMEEAARGLEFERASILRDRISAISSLGAGGPVSRGDLIEWQRTLSCLPHHEYPVALKRLKKLLHLGRQPRIIEGIDVANISGCEAVGSAVVFVKGKAHKNSYRRYRIKFASPRDDSAMIGEIVQRRFRRKIEEKEELPAILLVDGGKGQAGSAKDALKKTGATVTAVVGLAKGNERIYLPDGTTLDLERTDPALKLLQFVRDEAHRFAQHYHHILRRKALKGEK